MIELKLIEKYGPDGWQDDEGVVWYDDTFDTPWGQLGALTLEKEDGWTITKADGVILFNKGVIDGLAAGLIEDECTQVRTSSLGFRTVLVTASNGYVVYQLVEDKLRWSDTGESPQCYLATLNYQDLKVDDESSS